jgi:hypothetical protein
MDVIYTHCCGLDIHKKQTASQHYLPLWGMKPTVLDHCNLLDLHTLTRTY